MFLKDRHLLTWNDSRPSGVETLQVFSHLAGEIDFIVQGKYGHCLVDYAFASMLIFTCSMLTILALEKV